ncbi:major facilitator superfamily domain-containing protein [Collybia nuda]|uniref:Major facilitator superfamily domain-containing protein n=1 Tax=Collybia nuda TaxID=64659 RepID=A0A9P6CGT8_9AGAR|nr:major facilitator superfamily domain-containing protein [Collybia nuda]
MSLGQLLFLNIMSSLPSTLQPTLYEAYSLRNLQNSDHDDPNSNRSQRSPVPARPERPYQTLLLLSGFFMIFHVIGINSLFGIFQELYTSPNSSISDAKQRDALVSLVGTIGSGLTWSGSIFVNPMIARTENLKLITITGVVIMSLGLILASFSTKLWHLYLTQALLYGVGSSMYYFPIMSITPLYFDKHRGFAMGVILAGSGIGGLVLAPVLQVLLDKYGIHWALRIIGLWNLLIGIPVASVVKHRPGFNIGSRTRMNMSLVKRGTFLYQAGGALLQAAGNIIPMYYLTSYSVSVLSYSRSTGSLLLALNSGVNSIARVVMGILADQVGRQNTMIGSVLLSGLSVLALWYDAPRARFISFVVLYGIYAGGYNALLPTTITEIYGVENYTTVNGFIYFVRGMGSILGAPLAGVILGNYQRGGGGPGKLQGSELGALKQKFNDVVVYDGVLLLSAALCVGYVRWLDARDRGRWSWKA